MNQNTRSRRRWRRIAPLVGVTAAASLLATSCASYIGIPGVSCSLTPANSFWRADVRNLAVHPSSATWLGSIGTTRSLKADFGSGLWDGGPIGIPYTVVDSTTGTGSINFTYADESDPGPYPLPASPNIEGGTNSTGDRHVLSLNKSTCMLYETWDTHPTTTGPWSAGSGAIFDTRSNAMRPDGWTSADAAGLPVLPGLVRWEEVNAGQVHHAIRITVPTTQRAYVWPASHQAGSTSSTAYPPMGAWLRLKASVNEANFDPAVRPIIVALKTYGAVIADNGSAFFMSGAPDERWDNDKLATLGSIKGSDFDFVDTRTLQVAPGSYQASTAS